MKPSAEVLAAAVEKIRLSNPPHFFFLPDGCTRAEAGLLIEQEQEAHPWQIVIPECYVGVGEVKYNKQTGKWDYIWPEDRNPPP